MNVRQMSSSMLAVLTAGFWAGCATHASAPGSQPTSQRSATLQTELVYTRAGGFVGTNDRVAIKPDGHLEASGRMLGQHAGQLDAPQLAELAELLKDWSKVEVQGRPPSGAADYFQLSITYAGKTVTWTSLTPGVPDELTRLASRVEELAKAAN
jgi:hypothetical protein